MKNIRIHALWALVVIGVYTGWMGYHRAYAEIITNEYVTSEANLNDCLQKLWNKP